MSKIGHDVVAYSPKENVKKQFVANKMGRNSDYRERILEALRSTDRPLNITEVAKATGINYMTVRYILMELLLIGKVDRFEAGQSVFYRIPKK